LTSCPTLEGERERGGERDMREGERDMREGEKDMRQSNPLTPFMCCIYIYIISFFSFSFI